MMWIWCWTLLQTAWAQDQAPPAEAISFADRAAPGVGTQVARQMVDGQIDPEGIVTAETIWIKPSEKETIVQSTQLQVSIPDPLMIAILDAWSGVNLDLMLTQGSVSVLNRDAVVKAVTANRRRTTKEASRMSGAPSLTVMRGIITVVAPVDDDVEMRQTLYHEGHTHSLLAPAGRTIQVGAPYRYPVTYTQPLHGQMMPWQAEARVTGRVACADEPEPQCVALHVVMTPAPDEFQRDAYLWVDEAPKVLDRTAIRARREIALRLDPTTLHEHRREVTVHTKAWGPGGSSGVEIVEDTTKSYISNTTWTD